MKKTLIAMALLAAAGAASAQVTITPYARVDIGMGVTTSSGAHTSDTGLVAIPGAYNSNFFGIKGESDLGNGMKALAQLEATVSAGTGTSFVDGGTARPTFIGLTGGFGTLVAGLVGSSYDDATLDALEYNGFSAMSSAWFRNGAASGNTITGVHSDLGNDGATSGYTKGALKYTSPDMNGFNATVTLAPSKTSAVAGKDTSYAGFGLNYAKGPIAVSFGYEH